MLNPPKADSLSQRRCFRFFEKNFLRIFFNHAFGVTESASWRTPYVTTGNNLELQTLIILKLKLVLYLKRLQLFLNLTPMRFHGNDVDKLIYGCVVVTRS